MSGLSGVSDVPVSEKSIGAHHDCPTVDSVPTHSPPCLWTPNAMYGILKSEFAGALVSKG
jgi:hypothetical protein